MAESNPPGPRAARQAARLLEIVLEVEEAVAARQPADKTLAAAYRARPELGSRDRRLISGCVFALWRWRGWCGSIQSDGPLAVLRAHLLDRPAEPTPAALDVLVPPPHPLPPAFQGLEDRAAWVSKHWKPGARIEDLVPAWALDALATPSGVNRIQWTARWIASLQQRPPLWLRAANGDGPALVRRLADAGQAAAADPRVPGAVVLPDYPSLPDLERRVGPLYEVQDIASQVVGQLCGARPGERWWDACAGAGGKALALATAIGNHGLVVATDRRSAALAEGRRRARRTDARGIRWLLHDAHRSPPGDTAFDGVLLDAPCAGLGTWARAPDARWRERPEDVAAAARLQRELLESAARAVRPGGRLVYAVCSLTSEETVGVVEPFFAAHPAFRPDAGAHPLDPDAPADWRFWIWPWMGPGTGMFAARLRRIS